jgi:hypothetical protein
MGQAKFFLAERLPDAPLLPALAGVAAVGPALFQNIPAGDWVGAVVTVGAPEEADAILVPHHWREAMKRGGAAYADRLRALARETRLPVVAIAYGDSHAPIDFPGVFLRPSLYAQAPRENEIAMPAYVEDLGAAGVAPARFGGKPSVGFVGRAGFAGVTDALRYAASALLAPHPFKDGRYYRRALVRALGADPRVDSRFVVRRRYSGHAVSIELAPEDARREYVENMAGAEFGLAPKGDGNYSLRFYELLSLGRIPVVPDTGVVLPLEDEIPYGDFVVKVPLGDIPRAGEIVAAWRAARGEEGMARASAVARDAFARLLYAPRFFAEATRLARLAPLLARAKEKILR